MTDKQRRFIDEYLIDSNGAQAAIRAGYSAKTARKKASDLLRLPEISAAVKKRQDELSGKLRITQEQIIEELANIGFSKIAEDRDKIKALAILLKRFDNNDDRYDKLDAVLAKIEGNI